MFINFTSKKHKKKSFKFCSIGKMVCTGAKSEAESKLAARKYARIIQKLGFPVNIYYKF